jgi:hypothetical protein
MKRIYNTDTGKPIWRGTDYLVDGHPATVDPPLYLLTDVTRQALDYDAATHRLQSIAPHADLEAGEWVLSSLETVELTAEELAAREAAKLAAIKAAAMSAPYAVLPEGFSLATAESDQNAFTRLLQLLGIAQAPDEMPVTIADAEGQKHTVTVARLREILVGYGFEIHSRWAS